MESLQAHLQKIKGLKKKDAQQEYWNSLDADTKRNLLKTQFPTHPDDNPNDKYTRESNRLYERATGKDSLGEGYTSNGYVDTSKEGGPASKPLTEEEMLAEPPSLSKMPVESSAKGPRTAIPAQEEATPQSTSNDASRPSQKPEAKSITQLQRPVPEKVAPRLGTQKFPDTLEEAEALGYFGGKVENPYLGSLARGAAELGSGFLSGTRDALSQIKDTFGVGDAPGDLEHQLNDLKLEADLYSKQQGEPENLAQHLLEGVPKRLVRSVPYAGAVADFTSNYGHEIENMLMEEYKKGNFDDKDLDRASAVLSAGIKTMVGASPDEMRKMVKDALRNPHADKVTVRDSQGSTPTRTTPSTPTLERVPPFTPAESLGTKGYNALTDFVNDGVGLAEKTYDDFVKPAMSAIVPEVLSDPEARTGFFNTLKDHVVTLAETAVDKWNDEAFQTFLQGAIMGAAMGDGSERDALRYGHLALKKYKEEQGRRQAVPGLVESGYLTKDLAELYAETGNDKVFDLALRAKEAEREQARYDAEQKTEAAKRAQEQANWKQEYELDASKHALDQSKEGLWEFKGSDGNYFKFNKQTGFAIPWNAQIGSDGKPVLNEEGQFVDRNGNAILTSKKVTEADVKAFEKQHTSVLKSLDENVKTLQTGLNNMNTIDLAVDKGYTEPLTKQENAAVVKAFHKIVTPNEAVMVDDVRNLIPDEDIAKRVYNWLAGGSSTLRPEDLRVIQEVAREKMASIAAGFDTAYTAAHDMNTTAKDVGITDSYLKLFERTYKPWTQRAQRYLPKEETPEEESSSTDSLSDFPITTSGNSSNNQQQSTGLTYDNY